MFYEKVISTKGDIVTEKTWAKGYFYLPLEKTDSIAPKTTPNNGGFPS